MRRSAEPEGAAKVDGNNKDKDKGGKTKYSLKTYIIAMLIVVISVVVLSYFASQRNGEAHGASGGGDSKPADASAMADVSTSTYAQFS